MTPSTRAKRIATVFAALTLGTTGLLATAPAIAAAATPVISSPSHTAVANDMDWPQAR